MSNNTNDNSAAVFETSVEAGLDADLNPALLNLVISSRSEGEDNFLLDKQIARGFVDVIAQLHDPEEKVAGLNVSQKVGQLVTGTIDIDAIEAVRTHPNVISLEMARELYPALDRSVYEMRAHREQIREALPAGAQPFDGTGVVIGIADHGCDFAHPNFRKVVAGSLNTRLLYLWDQHGEYSPASPAGYPYGREFSAPLINQVLREEPLRRRRDDAYSELGYKPAANAHGTHVMDIAAGNGRGTCFPGVAPSADIIFVDLSTDDGAGSESIGNSRRLLEAVKYIFDKADAAHKPAVVNISINGREGPHDGSTNVERWLDELLKVDGRAIVIAASNLYDDNIHASGELEAGQSRLLHWDIPLNDKTDNKVEIWYGGENELELILVSPGGVPLGPFPLGTVKRIWRNGREVARVAHGKSYTNNGDHLITIFFSTAMESGRWSISLTSLCKPAVTFHAWIAFEGPTQSRFAPGDADPSHTLGTISCGASTITVGAYDPLKPNAIFPESSAGPTRSGEKKPEVSAPGTSINVAVSLFDHRSEERSGTSLAAPHVAGMIALLMQAAGAVRLTTEQIRRTVIRSARKAPPDACWDPRYGYGRVDALAAIQTLAKTAL